MKTSLLLGLILSLLSATGMADKGPSIKIKCINKTNPKLTLTLTTEPYDQSGAGAIFSADIRSKQFGNMSRLVVNTIPNQDYAGSPKNPRVVNGKTYYRIYGDESAFSMVNPLPVGWREFDILAATSLFTGGSGDMLVEYHHGSYVYDTKQHFDAEYSCEQSN